MIEELLFYFAKTYVSTIFATPKKIGPKDSPKWTSQTKIRNVCLSVILELCLLLSLSLSVAILQSTLAYEKLEIFTKNIKNRILLFEIILTDFLFSRLFI